MRSSDASRAGSILLVDDDESIREILGQILTDEGYEVTEATDGRAALDHLRGGTRPDLILLDLMMPVLDGWRFRTEQLRDPKLAVIPVVIITAGPADMVPREIEVLHKPMSAADLLSVASRYVGRASAPRSEH